LITYHPLSIPPIQKANTSEQHDPDCGQKINALTNNALSLILDTIATPATAAICAEAITSVPSPDNIYINLMDIPFPRPDVKNVFFLGYTVSGEEFEIEGTVWPPEPEDFELTQRMMNLGEKLVGEGKIRAHPSRVEDGGLEGILNWMQLLKEHKVSGVKLVYRVGEP
jgi:hypothetical protein